MEDCLFCKIIKKEIDSLIIYEDEMFLVFLDKFPKAVGHLLIIPKIHIKDVKDISDDLSAKLNVLVKKMIELLEEKLNIDGLSIIQNNGICQEIKHYHIHLIPKYKEVKNMTFEESYHKLIEK